MPPISRSRSLGILAGLREIERVRPARELMLAKARQKPASQAADRAKAELEGAETGMMELMSRGRLDLELRGLRADALLGAAAAMDLAHERLREANDAVVSATRGLALAEARVRLIETAADAARRQERYRAERRRDGERADAHCLRDV